jgi:hypothetical protein
MATSAHVYRLDSYGLTLAGMQRLGARQVRAAVHLSGKAARALWALSPSERQRVIGETLVRQLKRLQRAVPEAAFAPRNPRKPWTLDVTLPARNVAALAAAPAVASIFITNVEGRVPSQEKPTLRWHCVWGIVAIQVEGQTNGMITLEDRLVAVRAFDPEDATRRLEPMWRRYAEPYVNPAGQLVRWQLLSIQEVYDTYDQEIDPQGTEIFSRLRRVRMKPDYRWSSTPPRLMRTKTRRRQP